MTKDEIKDYLIRLHHSAFRNEKQIRNSRICFYRASVILENVRKSSAVTTK